jgi:23S rRNA (guanosine2251-2'-O)-methyltransferase
MLNLAKERGEAPFILILDALQDPQNLGTLLRTAEAVGVHGVLLPLRQTATITPAVVTASSGASEHLLVGQSNLAQAMDILVENNLWLIGLDGGPESQPLEQVNLKGPLGLVVGNEGQGMRRLVREKCDVLLRLPMRGNIESLNAAVAGSVALYLALGARAGSK